MHLYSPSMVCDIHSVLLKYYQVSLSSCLVMHSGKLNIHAHSHGIFFISVHKEQRHKPNKNKLLNIFPNCQGQDLHRWETGSSGQIAHLMTQYMKPIWLLRSRFWLTLSLKTFELCKLHPPKKERRAVKFYQ